MTWKSYSIFPTCSPFLLLVMDVLGLSNAWLKVYIALGRWLQGKNHGLGGNSSFVHNLTTFNPFLGAYVASFSLASGVGFFHSFFSHFYCHSSSRIFKKFKTSASLINIRRRKDESLKSYLARFNRTAVKIKYLSPIMVAFHLSQIKFWRLL